jgi:glucose-6-phosphate isomerase
MENRMSGRDGWKDFGDWLVDLPELGFRLDLSRMGLSTSNVQEMSERFDDAFDEMEELESGAIANEDEGRRVGHYWLRAPEMAPDKEIREEIETVRRQIVEFAAAEAAADRFDQLLVIGIGGSALGPQFVADALGRGERDAMRPFFLDNTDPNGIERTLDQLRPTLKRTVAVIISKSGGTPETRNGMLAAKVAFEAADLRFGAHAIAVTGRGSKLDRYAEEQGFIERFPMPDWVGGRTSETSVVGLLPAAMQGIEIDQLLAGAAAMDAATRSRTLRHNPAAMLALAWYQVGEGRGAKDMVILPYRDRLQLFSRYLQQLVMKSVGKELDREGQVVHQGIAVYGNKGSTDQHAYVQQLRDGLSNFFVTFIEVLEDGTREAIEVESGTTAGDYLNGFLIGTRQALYDNGRPSLTITIERISAYSIGMLIALYERAVGLYAELIDVNAYHQPGVEAGKKAASTVLEIQAQLQTALGASEETLSAPQWAEAIGQPAATETVFHLLERLSRQPGRGVERIAAARTVDARYRRSDS